MDNPVQNLGDGFLEKSLLQGQQNAQNLVRVFNRVKEIGEEANRNNQRTNQVIKQFQKKLDETNKIANKAIDISRIDHNQDCKVVKAVYAKSTLLAKKWIADHHTTDYGGGDYLMKEIGQVRSAIYHELKDKYNVNVRSDLKMADLESCIDWINSLSLDALNAWRLADRQTTLDTLNKWESIHKLPLTKPKD